MRKLETLKAEKKKKKILGKDIAEELGITKPYYSQIENGQLLNFIDVDTVSKDELLKPFLGVNADNRLKNIVSTIQSEQNKIIRQDLKYNSIIQGVAGSGKTTVALHRIAYLVYNNRDIYDSNQYMVIGPNKFFGEYISSVLPDLDVNGVSQYDLIDFAQTFLKEKLDVENFVDILNNNKNEEKNAFAYYITSMDFKKEIDIYLKKYYDNLIPNEHLYFKDFKILDVDVIKDTYLSINDKFHKTLESKIDKTIAILSKKIEEKADVILEKILSQSLSKNYTKTIQNKIIRDREQLKKELNVSGSNILKLYFKKLIKTPIQIYLEILKKNEYLKMNNFDYDEKQKEIRNKKISKEDLTPLMYIKYRLYGAEEFSKYRHVVIDEAQDYNTFTFYVLKNIMYNSTFSIYGDLAQSLYSYKSIQTWEEIIDSVFNGECEILYLNKSYRTTIEIMNEANKINELLGYSIAIPVIRHGKEVQYVSSKENNLYNTILEIINNSLNKNYKSIAVICKNQPIVEEVRNNLSKIIDFDKTNENNQNSINSICCISSYLSKGLEFDL
ncbi:MAG: HelD family protein [Bacilli bacterium]